MGLPITDRRVRRTHDLLRKALLALLLEKGYDRITVQDILDRADVGRSTFYAHFRDKDDLLRSGFSDVYAALEAERKLADADTAKRADLLQPMLVIFEHVDAHRHVWRVMTKKGGADLITRVLRENVTDLVEEHFRSQFKDAADPLELQAAIQFVTGACIGLLVWWLDNDPGYSAAEIHATFRRIATQGVRQAMAAN